MIRALLGLFRRCPPHLRARVPAEGFCSKEYEHDSEAYVSEALRAIVTRGPKWTPPPDEAGRAFLRSAPPANRDPINASATLVDVKEEARVAQVFAERDILLRFNPTWSEAQATICAATRVAHGYATPESQVQARMAQQRHVSTDEQLRMRAAQQGPTLSEKSMGLEARICVEVGMECSRPEMVTSRPAPAENARRYSEEDGTW